MALTEKQKKEYLQADGRRCPYCGSKDIDAESFNSGGDQAWQRIDCRDCDKSWHDIYTLTDMEEGDD